MIDFPGSIRNRVASEANSRLDAGMRQAIGHITKVSSGGVHANVAGANGPDDQAWRAPSIEARDLAQTKLDEPHAAAAWRNPVIAAAAPVLLALTRLRCHGASHPTRARNALTTGLKRFRRDLPASMAPEDVEHTSFLLCTFVDEVLNNQAVATADHAPRAPESRLLIDLHNSAWGGETCFEHLEHYLAVTPVPSDIIGFYDLILSLGLKGKYNLEEYGAAGLALLRGRVRQSIAHDGTGAPLWDEPPVAAIRPRRRMKVGVGLVVAGAIACSIGYFAGAWQLRARAAPVLASIAVFEPVERPRPAVDIQHALPPDIADLVAEGWLQVVKKDDGWLLLFTSDNAFASAQAVLTAEYRQKVARLGRALAPWPGALEVVGHTDNQPIRRGPFADNLALSLARAQSVQAALRTTANVLQPQREVTAVGRGDTDPAADNATEEGRRANRRVDVLWKVLAESEAY
jgi:type VI secretion system protein ImpK